MNNKRRVEQKLRKFRQMWQAIGEGKISWEEFHTWFDCNFGIKGTGPIVQKMLEEKWRLWDELRKSASS